MDPERRDARFRTLDVLEQIQIWILVVPQTYQVALDTSAFSVLPFPRL